MTAVRCVRCDRADRTIGVRWPEGPLCIQCYHAARGRVGACSGCHVDRTVPGLDAEGAPLCIDCAGLPIDLRCRRCGEEGDRLERDICTRCTLRDRLSVLLDDGTGRVATPMLPIFDAVVAMRRPLSGVWWLRNPAVCALLRDLATGACTLDHDAFDARPPSRTMEFVRELLIDQDLLPERNRRLAGFERWWTAKATTIADHDDRGVVDRFVRWHYLRRFRHAEIDGLTHGQVLAARQAVTIAAEFLTSLREDHVELHAVGQAYIEDWLVAGPSTRRKLTTFLIWAHDAGLAPKLIVADHRKGTVVPMTQDDRINLLRRLFHDDAIDLPTRVAGLLVLLYAQSAPRILRLLTADVIITSDGVFLRLTDRDPAPVSAPLDLLLVELGGSGHNRQTAANAHSDLLFPGAVPGQALTSDRLYAKLRRADVDIRPGRIAGLQALVAELPAAVAAQAVGYSATTTGHHAQLIAKDWRSYAAHRSRREAEPTLP